MRSEVFSLHIDTSRSWSGNQQQVLLTVLGLRELGCRAVLVAHPDGELLQRASEGHDLLRLAPRNEVDLHAAWRMSRILKDLKPDVVHAHDPHAVALASLGLAFNTSGDSPPLVASRRVTTHLRPHTFSRWKYHQVDRFIAASQAVRSTLLHDGVPSDRIVLVHSGIDIHRVQAEPPINVHAEFWLPTHAPLVGAAGALTTEKGHRHLIEAAAAVVRDVPDARFVIVGEGELRHALERQIHELHLEKHVFLAGFRPDALAFHKAFDVFVATPAAEGLGTALLSAMASAKAVVATEVGGIPEIVRQGETGIVVPPRDPEALAQAIVRLLKDDELRARMGRAGFEQVRRMFSAERMVEETLTVYRAVAASRHAYPASEADRGPSAGMPSPPSDG